MSKVLACLICLLLILGLGACSDNQAGVSTATPTVKSVNDLPLPAGVKRLDFSLDDLKKVSSLPNSLSLSGVEVSAYNTLQPAPELLKFYQAQLKTQGWSADEKRSQTNLLYFNKDSRISAIIALPIPSATAAETLSNVIPAFKGKIKAGDNLLILTQGPQSAFSPS